MFTAEAPPIRIRRVGFAGKKIIVGPTLIWKVEAAKISTHDLFAYFNNRSQSWRAGNRIF